MSQVDPELVRRITGQVLAALGYAATVPMPRDAAQNAPAPVEPPLDTCPCGESPSSQPRNEKAQGDVEPVPRVETKLSASALQGIVTANQLQAAMTAAADGVALLTSDARLTPLAQDVARQHATHVRRLLPGEGTSSTRDSGAKQRWLWWIEGASPVVETAVKPRRLRLLDAAAPRSSTALGKVVSELEEALRSQRAAGGLLFVRRAAGATCLANRHPSLRAMVGTCVQAVWEGMEDMGANVLIIEYLHHDPASVGALMDAFMRKAPRPNAAFERELNQQVRGG